MSERPAFDEEVAARASSSIHRAFISLQAEFNTITRRARRRFQQRDWAGDRRDAVERTASPVARVNLAGNDATCCDRNLACGLFVRRERRSCCPGVHRSSTGWYWRCRQVRRADDDPDNRRIVSRRSPRRPWPVGVEHQHVAAFHRF